MRDWFFYQERGKTMGPLTVDDLRARIRDGRIRLFDLIYKEGETGWRMALEHPDLREEFKKPAMAGLKDRPWVCLHRKSEESFEFITLGPYSSDELKEAIQAGKVSYNDYAWQSSFLEWKRIGNIEDFNARAARPTVKSSDAETVMVKIPEKVAVKAMPEVPEGAAELLKNVVEFKRGKGGASPPPVKANKPGEASGDDLTKILSVPPPFDPDATRVVNVNRPSTQSAPPPPPRTQFKGQSALPPIEDDGPGSSEVTVIRRGPVAEPSVGDVLERRPKKKRSRGRTMLMTDWGIVGVLVVVLVVVAALIVRRMGSHVPLVPPQVVQPAESQQASAGELSPQPAADAGKPAEFGPETLPPLDGASAGPAKMGDAQTPPAVEDKAPLPTAKPAPAAHAGTHEPSQLTLNVQNGNGIQARIEVRSNGSAEFPVWVQIIGLPGQVADNVTFYRYLRLKPNANPAKPLDLSALHLPAGRFIVRAETGKLKKETTINLGVGETSYRQAVAKIRKTYAAALWQERLAVYKQSLLLENAVAQALTSKHLVPRGLEALNAVKKANGANYIFFEEWWELKQILSDAKEHATSAELEHVKRVREHIATFSVWHK